MPAKKSGGAKMLNVLQKENPKGQSDDPSDSSDLSTIGKASFLEGLQQNNGIPLHSTALEEDLNDVEEEISRGKTERKEIPQPLKKTVKKQGAAAKGKEAEIDVAKEEEMKKKMSRKGAGATSAAGPMKNQQMKKGQKRASESGSEVVSGELESQEDTGTTQQRRRKVLSSEDEEGNEDQSWRPSPKKRRMYGLGRTRKSSSEKSRKSSSGSSSAGPEKSSAEAQRRKRRGRHGGTQFEVVLDAFLDFCEQYRESVESSSIKKSIDIFSSNVEEHIMEKISSCKELKVLERQNAKVASMICTKTQKLLGAKYELMRSERELWLLQKEKTDLKVRLADLRRGQKFLHDIGELNRQYLDHRKKHPKERETYGASSLSALLLEFKQIRAVEYQLKEINDQLKKSLKLNDTLK